MSDPNQFGGRLTPIDRSKDLAPWRRATELTACSLYWLPIKSFRAPDGQLAWLQEFLTRWAQYLSEKHGLREEIFAQFKTLAIKDKITEKGFEWMPTVGLSRRPGAPIQKVPDAQDLLDEMQPGGKLPEKIDPIDPTPYMPDYVYWMVLKKAQEQREELLGEGGVMFLFLPPSEETEPPEIPLSDEFIKGAGIEKQMDDTLAQMKGLYAMKDPFLAESKELFGDGLPRDLHFKGLIFIVPLLDAREFFKNPEDDVKAWLELLPVYMRESPEDNGFLLATSLDVEEDLINLLRGMREEGWTYPEI